ncbi:hypothetical protein F5146DRAFT_1143826 [Armillaria mellea]|nr:hypothetical protein F5146DRAFT_1143826 [Armillaria mellea]
MEGHPISYFCQLSCRPHRNICFDLRFILHITMVWLEDRTLTSKYDELKLESFFVRSSPSFYQTDRVAYTYPLDFTYPGLRMRNNSSSTATTNFKLTVETAEGELQVPQVESAITLGGHQSKVIVTDYFFGSRTARDSISGCIPDLRIYSLTLDSIINRINFLEGSYLSFPMLGTVRRALRAPNYLVGVISQPLCVSFIAYIFAILRILISDGRGGSFVVTREGTWGMKILVCMGGTEDTEGSLMSDGEDEETIYDYRRPWRAEDADQDVKFTWDTERAIEISPQEERTLAEIRKFRDELLDAESTSSDRPDSSPPTPLHLCRPYQLTVRHRVHDITRSVPLLPLLFSAPTSLVLPDPVLWGPPCR